MSDARDGAPAGRVAGLQWSRGGVPKLPLQRAAVDVRGMDGDWQRNRKYHGGPERALCLYSLELIQALAAEGHAIVAGAIGENVTIAGVPWAVMQPGARLRMGGVELELTAFAVPCRTIQDVFVGRRIARIAEKVNPGWSRVYARVLRAGVMEVGDPVLMLGAGA